jgi:serine/threonine protein kinase
MFHAMKKCRPDTMLIREASDDARQIATSARTLPPEVVEASIQRIGIIALVYAFTYFMVGILPAMLLREDRALWLTEVHRWIPPLVSIAAALAVAVAMRSHLVGRTKLRIGIGFEIFGSYGIAFAEYQDIISGIVYRDMGTGGLGLSWVTAWVMLFTIAVPTPPRTALVAALLSVSAVPVVFGVNNALGINDVALTAPQFFVGLILPNLLIVVMANTGARIVYGMGRAVREAREMGSYRLVEKLGQGGMGEVWRAEHRTLARPAAIKLIRPEIMGSLGSDGGDILQRRFEREAHATALLRSPHTIEVYDFGISEDGTFYYVMELLDGFDLDRLVHTFGPVPAERAVHFLRQMTDSLAEAHEVGLVHRDVKPANVYTCRQGRAVDFVKVLDFGLVKPSNPMPEGAVKLTAEHSVGGTPAFISPEQALGGETIDGRSDIYSVGCLGFWLLTGRNVFLGKTPMEVLTKHVSEQPPAPSTVSELPVPPELDALILRCLSKDPADRPQNGDELLDALVAVPLGESWTRARRRAWWHAHHVSTVPTAAISHEGVSSEGRLSTAG